MFILDYESGCPVFGIILSRLTELSFPYRNDANAVLGGEKTLIPSIRGYTYRLQMIGINRSYYEGYTCIDA